METIWQGIIENLMTQIGDSGLIIHAKALMHKSRNNLSLNEIDRLLMIFNTLENSTQNDILKVKFYSTLLYFLAEHNHEKAAIFSAKMEHWQNLNRSNRSSSNLHQLHLLYNLIEFEDKFHMLNSEKLKLLSIQLSTYEKLEKPFEEYILFKYYAAILKFHQKDYPAARNAYMDILVEIGDELNNTEKSAFIQYIELKNQILNLKILERESGDKEVMTSLETLMKDYSEDDSDVSIFFCLKASDVYNMHYEYSNSLISLTNAFEKVKKRLFFSNGKNIPDFIELYLVVLCRNIFCQILLGNINDSIKIIKKLEKLIVMMKQSDFSFGDTKNVLLTKYNFYLCIYKFITKQSCDKNEINKYINNYREKFKNQIEIEDDTIINIFSLNSTDVIAKNFYQKVNNNIFIIGNNKFIQISYLLLYFSLFNNISILTKNISTDSNTKKQSEYIDKILKCAKPIVDYINKYLNVQNLDTRAPFNYAYFKEVLIKIYFSYIFYFYFTKDYKKALEVYGEFERTKIELSLEDNYTLKASADLQKLFADILFKLEDYNGAINTYLAVIEKYEKILNHSQSMPLVLFDLGVCFFYVKDYSQAKKYLKQSLSKYETLNTINQNLFEEKVSLINKLLNSISHLLD